jgi:hypothetical protein
MDRLWALALLEEEAATHSCGQPISETFDPDNHDAYVAKAVKCGACAALAKEHKAASDPEQAADMDGMFFTVEKKADTV